MLKKAVYWVSVGIMLAAAVGARAETITVGPVADTGTMAVAAGRAVDLDGDVPGITEAVTNAAGGATTVLPKDLGVTTQNWLGRSQWTADPFPGGSLDDFRIYDRALSESEVRYLAGDR